MQVHNSYILTSIEKVITLFFKIPTSHCKLNSKVIRPIFLNFVIENQTINFTNHSLNHNLNYWFLNGECEPTFDIYTSNKLQQSKKAQFGQGFNSQSENPLEDVRTHFLHFSTFVKMRLNPKTSFFGPFPFLQLNFGHKPKVNVMTSNISFVILGNLKPINMPKYLTS